MKRAAFTLIELLVVVTIVAILGGATVVSLTTGLQDREVREGARSVLGYFSAARNRAAALGRPVGVVIQQYGGASGFAFTLSMADTPVPYGGDSTASLMTVTANGFAQITTGDSGWIGLLRIGDMVKLNYQGGNYRIAVANVDGAGYLTADNPGWIMTPDTAMPKSLPTGVPFQVFRYPVRSAIGPLQLPFGVVVDLFSSGMVNSEFYPADGSPVIIMFAPDGSVCRVYYADSDLRPPCRIYLLIGRRENIPNGGLDPNANWRSPASQWVTIDPRTGQVTSTENVAADPAVVDPAIGLSHARSLAIAGKQQGGR